MKGAPARIAALAIALTIALAIPAPRAAEATGTDPTSAARALLMAGRFTAAESAARVVLVNAGRPGAASDSAAAIEIVLSAQYRTYRTGSLQACDLARRAVALRTGPDGHLLPGGAIDIAWLAVTLASSHQLAAADSTARRALAECGRTDSTETAECGTVHDLVGQTWLSSARYADSRKEFEHAVAIRQRVLAPNDSRIADSWCSLGTVCSILDDRVGSERAMQNVLAMRAQGLPEGHADVVRALLTLARTRHNSQDYPAALEFSDSALAMQLKSPEPDKHLLGYVYLQVAWDVNETGDDARSLEMGEQAWQIFRSADGPDGARTQAALSTLAEDCVYAGECGRGAAMAESCVASQRRVHGNEWPDLWRAWETLSLARLCVGDAAGALEAADAGVAAIQRAHLDQTSSGQTMRRRRAEALEALGRWEEAGAVYRTALAFGLEHFGPDNRDVSMTRDHMTQWYLHAGYPDSARVLLERMTAEMDSLRGPRSRDSGRARASLAAAVAASGDTARALPLALEAESIGREEFRVIARGLGEHQALAEANIRARGLDLALAFGCARSSGDSARREVWDTLIRSRALVLDEMAARRRERPTLADSAGRELVAARENLATLLARGSGSDAAKFGAQVLEATDRVDRAEREVALSSPLVRRDRARSEIGLRDVESALGPGEAMVAFARIHVSHGHLPDDAYVVLTRGAQGQISIVRLGAAAKVDDLVAAWRAELGRDLSKDAATRMAAERRCREAGVRVRHLIWDPIQARLAGAKRVVLIPDGALSLIPFQALPIGASAYLVESGPTIVRVGAERDLVQPQDRKIGSGLLAMGGMRYDTDAADRRESAVVAANASDRGLPPCQEFGEVRFASLPGTGEEVTQVSKLFADSPLRSDSDRLVTGAEATERAFRSLAPGRRAIHLATHGFFVDPTCSGPAARSARGTGGLAPSNGDLPTQMAVDPLRLAGLAFAGANGRAGASDGENDGVLTAGEVAGLDLDGAEIVTLSACESGLGIPVSGEGVLGLDRAFQAAGARAVIMSLWSVDDQAARAWMSDFYRALWQQGRDAAEAAREASRAALIRLRKSGGATHPGAWAMFISSGLTR